jgi:cell fate regulator YaaT (PSP1 superfamily)
MAKEQNLALNPMKLSGICGRLLCCLAYENKDYAAMRKQMPQPKQEVSTPWGKAKVISINVLKETVTVQLDDETVKEVTLGELINPQGKS